MTEATEAKLRAAQRTWTGKFKDAANGAGQQISHEEARKRADKHVRQVAKKYEDK